MNGLFILSGQVSTGKTSAALSFGFAPQEICYINLDSKKTGIGDLFGKHGEFFGLLSGGKELDMINSVVSMFEEAASDDSIKCIIIDGYEVFSKFFFSYIIDNMSNVRQKLAGGGSGAMGNQQRYGMKRYIEAGMLAEIAKTKAVFIISHMESKRVGKETVDTLQVPGIDNTNNLLRQKATLFFMMVPTEGHSSPSALVVKNSSSRRYDKKKNQIVSEQAFPPVLSPHAIGDGYVSLYDMVNHYYENPVGDRELESYEKLTDLQRRMVTPALSDVEQEMLMAQVRAENMEGIQSLVEENVDKPYPKILRIVRDAGFSSVTIADVKRVVDSIKKA